MPLSPFSCELAVGVPFQFGFADAAGTAQPAPPNTTWTANPPGAGDLSATGEFTPRDLTQTPVTIAATTAGAPPVVQTATVHLVPPSITIFPAHVRLRAGEKQKFSVVVRGDPRNRAIWSVAPAAEAMTNGDFTAAESIDEPQTVTITAIFPGDPAITAAATADLIPEPTNWKLVWPLMLYLAGIFSLVVVLAALWPPGGDNSALLDSRRSQLVTAQSALDKATADQKPAAAQKVDDVKKLVADAEDSVKKMQDAPVATWWWGSISRELDLLWMVLITGALGSFVYSARSFVDFVGNKKFRASWSAWYLMYPLIGSALALMFYLVIRGGFLTISAKGSDINVYGLIAISGLSGMFSKQATNKLDEMFTTMFKTDKDDKALKDKLEKPAAAAKPDGAAGSAANA
jgi:hypothetical protein